MFIETFLLKGYFYRITENGGKIGFNKSKQHFCKLWILKVLIYNVNFIVAYCTIFMLP